MTIMLSGYSGAEFDVNGVRVFRCRDETHAMGLCRCCGERALRRKDGASEQVSSTL